MKLVNRGRYTDAEIRELLRFAFHPLGDGCHLRVTVVDAEKHSTGLCSSPSSILVRLAPENGYPSILVQRRGQPIVTGGWLDWREALVAIAAHEIRHATDPWWDSSRTRIDEERRADAWEARRLDDYRSALAGEPRDRWDARAIARVAATRLAACDATTWSFAHTLYSGRMVIDGQENAMADPEAPEREVALGSRWYVWGFHAKVVELTRRDGETAARLHRDGDAKPMRTTVPARAISQYGLPSGAPTNGAAPNGDVTTEEVTMSRTTPAAARKRTPGPKEQQLRDQREAAAKPPAEEPVEGEETKDGAKPVEKLPASTVAEATRPKRTRSTASSDKTSARTIAHEILAAADKPMTANEIATAVIDSGRATGLKGKTPKATIAAQLYTSAKKGELFKIVKGSKPTKFTAITS